MAEVIINTKIINVNMKQKKIGSDLYVFDTSAYELTKDLDAENIYIQQELIPGYLAVNSSTGVQEKIKPINYKLNIVNKPVWGDYIYGKVDVTPVFKRGTKTMENPYKLDSFDSSTGVSFKLQDVSGDVIDSSYSLVSGSDNLQISAGEDSELMVPQNFGEAVIKAEWQETEDYHDGSTLLNVKVVPVLQGYNGSKPNTEERTKRYLDGTEVYVPKNTQKFPGMGKFSVKAFDFYFENFTVTIDDETLYVDTSDTSGLITLQGQDIDGSTNMTISWDEFSVLDKTYNAGSVTYRLTTSKV